MPTLKSALKLTVEYLGVINVLAALRFVAGVPNQLKACIVRLRDCVSKLVIPKPTKPLAELAVRNVAIERECSDGPLVVNLVSPGMSPVLISIFILCPLLDVKVKPTAEPEGPDAGATQPSYPSANPSSCHLSTNLFPSANELQPSTVSYSNP